MESKYVFQPILHYSQPYLSFFYHEQMVEYIAEQLYSPSPSDASVEINTLKERVDLDGGLS